MSEHSTLTSLFSDIADSIRAKTGSNGLIKADEFPDAIDDISTGIVPSGSISITKNGTYDVTEKASAVVNVSGGGDPTDTILFENFTDDYPEQATYYFKDKRVMGRPYMFAPYTNGTYVYGINLYIKTVVINAGWTYIQRNTFNKALGGAIESVYLFIDDAANTTIMDNSFLDSLSDLYVSWSIGDVAGAPWGATNATIHYNYVPE